MVSPTETRLISEAGQFSWSAICETAQSVSEPWFVTATMRPRNCAIVLTEPSGRTTRTRIDGGPDKAATPVSGAPFGMNARTVPEPRAMSMLPATTAWIIFACVIWVTSTSSPLFWKVPSLLP